MWTADCPTTRATDRRRSQPGQRPAHQDGATALTVHFQGQDRGRQRWQVQEDKQPRGNGYDPPGLTERIELNGALHLLLGVLGYRFGFAGWCRYSADRAV